MSGRRWCWLRWLRGGKVCAGGDASMLARKEDCLVEGSKNEKLSGDWRWLGGWEKAS